MIPLRPLCTTCKGILERDGPGKQKPSRSSLDNRDHHLTAESLREAVRSKCYICTLYWDRMSQGSAAAPVVFRATMYNSLEEDGTFNLWISPLDEPLPNVMFTLIDAESADYKKYFSFTTLAPSTSSSSTLGLAYGWYMSCRAMHKSCRQLVRELKWYPTRLVDVGLPGDHTWKLHICADETMKSPNYMTLSYRWPETAPWKLTQAKLDHFRKGESFQMLPQLFRDAVTVAHRFSVRYLWIDSLCIIQDSHEDWERESSAMRDVYTNSSCNISATASLDPSDGLFRTRQDNFVPGQVVLNSDSIQKTHYIFNSRLWHHHVTDTALNRRGWVFQERLLAPRVLYFGKHQLLWECFTDQKCEAFPDGLPFERSIKSISPMVGERLRKKSILSRRAVRYWKYIVTQYSRCALTRPEDKLVALSGLARLFHEFTGDEYVCGLWKSRLLEFLLWESLYPMTQPTSDYIAPSWSWACGNGHFMWRTSPNSRDMHLASVLDAVTHASSSDATGRLLGGFIRVRGPVVWATCEERVIKGTFCHLWLRSWPAEGIDTADYRSVHAYLMEDFKGTQLGGDRDLFLLALCSQFYRSHHHPFFRLSGLILEPVSSSSSDFIRIGHFRTDEQKDMEKFGVCTDAESGSVSLNDRVHPTVVTIV